MTGNWASPQLRRVAHCLIYSAEEMLLDFRELTAEHSGENMCDVLWDTLEAYGIEDKVSSMMDVLSFC